MADRIYYIPNAHTLDGRLKGVARAKNHDDRDNDILLSFLLPSIYLLIVLVAHPDACNVSVL